MAPGETTRPTLLARVRDPRDEASWKEFDARYRGLILAYCLRRGLQAADAEDVRQIVMLGLSRSLRGFEYRPDRGRFRDWLGRVVRNAVARYRAGWRPVEGEAPEPIELAPAEGDELDEAWEREWVHHHFRLAMERSARAFEPATLEVFERLLEGATPADVAAASGLTVDAVYKIRTRVREHLHILVAEQVRAEELAELG